MVEARREKELQEGRHRGSASPHTAVNGSESCPLDLIAKGILTMTENMNEMDMQTPFKGNMSLHFRDKQFQMNGPWPWELVAEDDRGRGADTRSYALDKDIMRNSC